MLKKIIAATMIFTFVLMPVKDIVFHDSAQTVSAKGYRSGVKSFNSNKGSGNSFFQNKNPQQNKQKSFFNNNKSSAKSQKGGFLKGMMFGGIAGLLFGGMLANMGGLGSLLGILINIIAILVVISLIGRIFNMFRNNRRTQEEDRWRK